jgi:hypothetical protein
MLCYDNAMELRRRPWQRRIEVYSPKIQRRLTLFSRDAHDAWLLLEADPEVRTFCERPAYVAGEAGRLIDFWVDRGRHAKFWILGDGKDEDAGLPATLHGVAVRIIHRADMIAAEMRVKNWSQIIPYLISFTGACRLVGLTANDYPLNQDEQGVRSLRGFFATVWWEDLLRSIGHSEARGRSQRKRWLFARLRR